MPDQFELDDIDLSANGRIADSEKKRRNLEEVAYCFYGIYILLFFIFEMSNIFALFPVLTAGIILFVSFNFILVEISLLPTVNKSIIPIYSEWVLIRLFKSAVLIGSGLVVFIKFLPAVGVSLSATLATQIGMLYTFANPVMIIMGLGLFSILKWLEYNKYVNDNKIKRIERHLLDIALIATGATLIIGAAFIPAFLVSIGIITTSLPAFIAPTCFFLASALFFIGSKFIHEIIINSREAQEGITQYEADEANFGEVRQDKQVYADRQLDPDNVYNQNQDSRNWCTIL